MAGPVGTKRVALIWGGLLVVVAAAFVITVAVLNATVYSPSGFVRSYLGALDRGDTRSALTLAGVQPAESDDLLAVSEKGRLDGFRITRDLTTGDSHRILVEFRADGQTQHATFVVERTETIGGLFRGWGFRTAPTASIDITPSHDPRFIANGVDIEAKAADVATRYTVLAPAVFDLSHDTTYLRATALTAVVATPGSVATASVVAVPKRTFVEKVTSDVAKYLTTTCLPQKVLLPSGCPFGEAVDDRLTSDPKWTMTKYPPVSLRSTGTAGVWLVSRADGEAHLEVDAQSLYDGHSYTIDEDVEFDVEYLVTIGSDNGLTITPR